MAVEQIGGAAAAAMPALASASHPRQAPPATSAPAGTEALGAQAAQAGEPAVGVAQVREAVDKIERVVSPAAQDLRFSIDDETGITVVKLIDTETQTVLRQIPTEEVLEISKALDKLQGLLVRNKA